jgi:hypothetical protein
MLIGISGKKGAGKDEAFKIIEEYMANVHNHKFAYHLKKIVSMLTGIEMYKMEDDWCKNNLVINMKTFKVGIVEDVKKIQNAFIVDVPLKDGYSPSSNVWLTLRCMLQDLGTEGLRSRYPNVWVASLLNKYDEDQNWVITDVRFPNEADAVREHGGVLIRINRDLENTSDHTSETALDDYGFDLVIDNNGTLEELKDCIISFLLACYFFKPANDAKHESNV